MRRDRRPFWLKQAQTACRRWYARQFLFPQFAALGPHADIVWPWHVEIWGANVRAGRHLHIRTAPDGRVRLTTWRGPSGREGSIEIGDACLFMPGAHIMAAERVTIGDGAMLASRVTIADCDWHGLYDRTAIDRTAPVTLGRNVWIGLGATICKGVTIGENSVIGAGAVVTRDVPADSVAAGNPARVIRELDPARPRRTRLDLFADEHGYLAGMESLDRLAHEGGTILAWMRAKLAPGPDD